MPHAFAFSPERARAAFQLTLAAAAYNLRRLAYPREARIEPF